MAGRRHLEADTNPQRYSGFWRRLAAQIVDGVIYAIVLFIAIIAFASQLDPNPFPSVDDGCFRLLSAKPQGFRMEELEQCREKSIGEQTKLRILSVAVTNVVGIIYFVGFLTWRGQTPGKTILRMRVVKTYGTPIGFRRAVQRELGYIVSALVLYIGYLMVGWDKRKQGLHDKIADTYVIRT